VLLGSLSRVREILILTAKTINLIKVHTPDTCQLLVKMPENNYQNRTRTIR
jgi:hypothetical protein